MPKTATATGVGSADVAALEGIIEPWIKACLDRDWDSLLGMCTDDIVFMQPNAPSVHTADVRAWLEAFPTVKAMELDMEHVEGSGDFAAVRGRVVQTVEDGGQEVTLNGKYLNTARRQADGSWRFASIMWGSNEPA